MIRKQIHSLNKIGMAFRVALLHSEHAFELVSTFSYHVGIDWIWDEDLDIFIHEYVLGEERNPWSTLETAFDDVLYRVQREGRVSVGDRMGISVEAKSTSGEIVYIHIPVRYFERYTGEYILEQIMNKLNSAQTLQFDFEVKITVLRRPSEFWLGADGRSTELAKFVVSKKSVIQIRPPNDLITENGFCFAQFLWLGLHYLESEGKLDEVIREKYEIQKSNWKKLVNGHNRFRERQTGVEKLCQLCPSVSWFNVSCTQLQEMEEAFHLSFVILDFNQHFQCVYPYTFPIRNDRPVLVGLVELPSKTEGESISICHIDMVTKPEMLVMKKRTRFCYLCGNFYQKKTTCLEESCIRKNASSCLFCHSCQHLCSVCHGTACLSEPKERIGNCYQCKRYFRNRTCKQEHGLCLLQRSYCPDCQGPAHGNLKCTEMKCKSCFAIVESAKMNDHVCFIRRCGLKKEDPFFLVYDFECCLDKEGRHIPYLATCWFPNQHPKLEALITRFASYVYVRNGVPSDNPVFVFWGLGNIEECQEGVYDFFTFLEQLENTIIFAHNAKAYDSIFVKRAFAIRNGWISKDIKRGQKFLQVEYVKQRLLFRDSISFIPCSLRYLSDDFGIHELRKGHFPHSIMTVSFLQDLEAQNYVTDRVPQECFNFDFGFNKKMEQHMSEAEKWYLEEYMLEPEKKWNVQTDAIDYCVSDTVLLGLVLQKFRKEILSMTDQIKRPTDLMSKQNLDPLQYVTLPSAVMDFYWGQLAPLEVIPVLDRSEKVQKIEAAEYFFFESRRQQVENVILQDCKRYGTFAALLNGKRFLYLNCYGNGCRSCFLPLEENARLKRTFGELQQDTFHWLEQFPEAVIMRECQWRQIKERNKEVQTCFDQWKHEWERTRPMDFRDAYKGGKTEIYKLIAKKSLSMVDYVSQYPTVLLGQSEDPFQKGSSLDWALPCGRFQYKSNVQLETTSRFGVAKACVTPPDQCYAPILSYKVSSWLNSGSEEVLYGLCRTCMINRTSSHCMHDKEERSFYGTWTLAELHYAKEECGYEIALLDEVLEFEQSSCSLFRDFIVPFMVGKICSKRKGIVNEQKDWTEQGKAVKQYLEDELLKRPVSTEEFEDNPSRRTECKLIMNSLTGKLGQREIFSSTLTFDEKQKSKVQQLLYSKNVEILDVDIYDCKGIKVGITYKPIHGSGKTHIRKNDILVAYITAYGRMMLNRVERRLGKELLGCDTDSAYHLLLSERPYQTGLRAGDLELELPKAFDWVSTGRKSYSYYEDEERKESVCKQKGVMLKSSNVKQFSPQKLEALILNTYQYECEHQENHKRIRLSDDYPRITTSQTLFVTEMEQHCLPFKKTVKRDKRLALDLKHFKRWIQWQKWDGCILDSIPYGTKE